MNKSTLNSNFAQVTELCTLIQINWK